jgi:hypothetical protein
MHSTPSLQMRTRAISRVLHGARRPRSGSPMSSRRGTVTRPREAVPVSRSGRATNQGRSWLIHERTTTSGSRSSPTKVLQEIPEPGQGPRPSSHQADKITARDIATSTAWMPRADLRSHSVALPAEYTHGVDMKYVCKSAAMLRPPVATRQWREARHRVLGPPRMVCGLRRRQERVLPRG